MRPLLLVLLLAACGGGSTGPSYQGPLTGSFADTLAEGDTARFAFVPGRSGATTVAICAREGADFDLAVGASRSAGAGHCERVTFDAVAGRSYQAVVWAAAGLGPVNGCWSTALVMCEPAVPPGYGGTDTAYYAPAEGRSGLALFQALADIVEGQRVFGYTTARDSLYAHVDDPDGDDLIADVYTGRVATVFSRSTAAAADFNTEHLWPRSRGADTAHAAGVDLHHLITSDETANAQRGNYPFGVVTGQVLWTGPDSAGSGDRSRLGYDGQGRVVFEPRDSRKGDVARAILYFLTRYYYDRPTGFSLANFVVEESTLVAWAQQDPPSDFERARNATIYRVQGNRNPYIDRPEFVTRVGDFPN